MYLYDQDAVDFADANSNSLRSYYGIRAIDNILIDIDKEQNTDEFTLRKCQATVYQLHEELDLPTHAFRVFFSGSGYHITLPNSVFNFTPSEELPFHVKDTIIKLFPDADPMVYMRTGLYRVAHTLNKKLDYIKFLLNTTK